MIGVDPIGKVGAGPNNNSIGGRWARKAGGKIERKICEIIVKKSINI